MADDPTSATGDPQNPSGTPNADPAPAPDPEPAAADNPDAFKRALDSERQARREAEKRAKELETRVSEFEDVHKSDLDKAQEELGRVKPEAERLTTENLRLQVALEKGLPTELVGRLQGSSKEDLETDADQLLALTKSNAPASGSFDNGARPRAPRPEPEPGFDRLRVAYSDQ